jgi:hypothetical protein
MRWREKNTLQFRRLGFETGINFNHLYLFFDYPKRPLKNAQFCSRPRKAKILTAGIHGVF